MGKFCSKCGAPIGENEKFCGKCGAPNDAFQANNGVNNNGGEPEPVQYQFKTPPANTKKSGGLEPAVAWVKKNNKLVIIAAAALVVVIVAIVVLCNIFKYQRIDPKDICHVEFYGIDGLGHAEATLDNYDIMKLYYIRLANKENNDFDYSMYEDMFGEDSKSKKKIAEKDCSPYLTDKKSDLEEAWTKADSKRDAQRMRDAIIDMDGDEYAVSFKIEKKDNLKNGDKVTVKVEYDEDELKEKNIKFTSDEFEVEVEGLAKAEKLDFFKNIDVSFEGNSGTGYAVVNQTHSGISINYEYDSEQCSEYSGTLSNGDKFKVTAKLNKDSSKVHKSGKKYWVKDDEKYYIADKDSDEKEYEVKDLRELEEVDIFEGVKIKLAGASPYIYVQNIDTSGAIDIVKDNSWEISFYRKVGDETGYYKKGDKVKIYAYVSNSLKETMADEGKRPAGTPDENGYYVKEFDMDENIGEYITADNAAKAEKALEKKIFSRLKSKYRYDYSLSSNERKKIAKAKYQGSFLLTAVEDEYNSYDPAVYMVSVYKIGNKFISISTSNVYDKGGKYFSDNSYYSSTLCYVGKSLSAIKSKVKSYMGDRYELTEYNKNKPTTVKSDDSSEADEDSSSETDESSEVDEDSSSETDDSSSVDDSSEDSSED